MNNPMMQDPTSPPWWAAAVITPILFAAAWLGRKIADVLAATYLADKKAALEERKEERATVAEERKADRHLAQLDRAHFVATLEGITSSQQKSMERLWHNQEGLTEEYRLHHVSEEKQQQLIAAAIEDNTIALTKQTASFDKMIVLLEGLQAKSGDRE